MTALPKWTEERTAALVEFVGDETPVSQETVADAAESLDPPTSTRSISSKLRKMGYKVELASARAKRAFSDEQADTLTAFVEGNSGEYTYAEIAKVFEDGAFSAKSIQGKILSLELTDHVAPAPKKESVKTYSEDEEATIIEMVANGAFMEAIAEALDRPLNSVRGKTLSLLRNEQIPAIPKQEHSQGNTRKDALAELGDVAEMTVDAIAAAIEKTPRGVRTMLTRRGLNCADYKGAERKEKAAKAAA